jgi:beta-N-acetylglucosaminidase
MKLFFLISVLATLVLSNSDCKQKKEGAIKYKGRLEIKGICMNYTISLLEGNMDTSKIAAGWIDENTNISYKNVFGLANPCSFPQNMKEGDDFYFSLNIDPVPDCIVCEAYYPTPPKKLSIKVVEP